MPDFRLAEAEFDRQAVILETLLDVIETAGMANDAVPVVISGRELPFLPGDAQNTMTASAIVLLAAHFEEYVRQQIEEYARCMISEYAHINSDVKEKLVEAYWKAGSSRISRIKIKGSTVWGAEAEPILRGLVDYPVAGNILGFNPKLICEHDANMRWDTLTELCGRVGVKKLAELMHRSKPLRNLLGDPKAGAMSGVIKPRFNEFIDLRNSVVHSISQNAGIGMSVVRNWLKFFRLTSPAFGAALDLAYLGFEEEINKAKAREAAG